MLFSGRNGCGSGAPRMISHAAARHDGQLWTLATTWYSTRLQEDSRRPKPDEMFHLRAPRRKATFGIRGRIVSVNPCRKPNRVEHCRTIVTVKSGGAWSRHLEVSHYENSALDFLSGHSRCSRCADRASPIRARPGQSPVRHHRANSQRRGCGQLDR
jgi:hypothetical protein